MGDLEIGTLDSIALTIAGVLFVALIAAIFIVISNTWRDEDETTEF